MTTEADKKISETKEYIDKASKVLAEVLTNDELLDEFHPGYQHSLKTCLHLLIEAKLTIKGD